MKRRVLARLPGNRDLTVGYRIDSLEFYQSLVNLKLFENGECLVVTADGLLAWALESYYVFAVEKLDLAGWLS